MSAGWLTTVKLLLESGIFVCSNRWSSIPILIKRISCTKFPDVHKQLTATLTNALNCWNIFLLTFKSGYTWKTVEQISMSQVIKWVIQISTSIRVLIVFEYFHNLYSEQVRITQFMEIQRYANSHIHFKTVESAANTKCFMIFINDWI